jgi:hypothetical protein
MLPLTNFLAIFSGWAIALNIFLALNLVLYSFLLCHWTATRPFILAFPLMLVTGIALWPNSFTGFILVALWVFAWIRSGICCKAAPGRKVFAEFITILGGAGFLLFWRPEMISALPVATWFFFLVQTLYYIIIPGVQEGRKAGGPDPFERARREMERIFETYDAG